ncbi:oligoendopeptidase F [Peptacetobacter hominis]|uniref:Oligopeptidase F n=1 Tax=Peptacetobacter hominis TaxID=2743610 RepID=A0A544QXL5_9FIRM|nr:oligoendopeptidase F [Peptacetobacter hominis]TQQ85477.1 oligoendopeptidase F [Peptacetobacter hominis]
MGIERKNIEKKYKWSLEKMYSSQDEIDSDIKKAEKLTEDIALYKGKISESSENLLEVFRILEDASRTIEKLYVYTHMRHHEDTRINENQAESVKTEMLSTNFGVASSYIVPEIMAMSDERLNDYLNDEKMSFYKKYMEDILRDRPHTLSEKEEQILASVSEISNVSESVYDMLAYADMEFPEIEGENGEKIKIDHFNYSNLIKSRNRRVRKDAFEGEFSTYKKYKNTFASSLYGAVKSEIFYSKMRKHNSAIEASLFADNISVDVYRNLIDAVSDSIPALGKYVDIKKKVLGVDELHMYDLYVPLSEKFEYKITYKEAQEIILNALKPLGEEYLSIIRKAFDERWIDVYENEGKKGGAYSWGCYDSHPYILMSYTDDLNSLFTLIHELGHSVHSYYSRTSQPYIYSDYRIFVAEVASTTNELLLINYLLENAKEKDEKIYLLNYYLEQFRTTVHRQTMFAEFEMIAHEKAEAGNPLTADEFTEIYYGLNKKYYGDYMNVDELVGIEWARIPHFYSNFYVYKYATGFSAASALSSMILSEGKEAVDRYIEFLKSGGSEYPLDQLRRAGVDMEKKESVEKALDVFRELVEKLEKEI